MAGFWYWFTSNTLSKKGQEDAKDGLPKISESGEIHIPPQLGIIRDTFEAKIHDVKEDYARSDNELSKLQSVLETRLANLDNRCPEKNHFAVFKYYLLAVMLCIMEIPITYIALESVFKENILLVGISCVAFSLVLVVAGHFLGQEIYEHEIIGKPPRMTKILIIVTIFLIAGLSYFRYIHQTNLITNEKTKIMQEAELAGGTTSPQVREQLDHLNSKSPAAISIVFFFLSAACTLLATHSSKRHCRNNCDKKFIHDMKEFLNEKLSKIQDERDGLVRTFEPEIEKLRESAQREFGEYRNGLIRSDRNTAEIMLKLDAKVLEVFALAVERQLETHPDVAEKIRYRLESQLGDSNKD